MGPCQSKNREETMSAMGIKKKRTKILGRNPKPFLRGGVNCPVLVSDAFSISFGSEAIPSGSLDFGRDSSALSGGDGAAGLVSFLVMMIICPQALHLALASSPLILAASISYFFPHSSQMTIMTHSFLHRLFYTKYRISLDPCLSSFG